MSVLLIALGVVLLGFAWWLTGFDVVDFLLRICGPVVFLLAVGLIAYGTWRLAS